MSLYPGERFSWIPSIQRHPRKTLTVTMGCTNCFEDTGGKPLLLVTHVPTTTSSPLFIGREGGCAHLFLSFSPGTEHSLLGTLGRQSVVLPTPVPNPSCTKLSLKCVLNPQTFTGITYEAERDPKRVASPARVRRTCLTAADRRTSACWVFSRRMPRGARGSCRHQRGDRLACDRALCNQRYMQQDLVAGNRRSLNCG